MATGQGPIYDDSITFPTDKTDDGAPSTPTTWPASDANNQGVFNYAARTAIRGGIYHGNLDQSGGLPPLSSGSGTLSTTWTSNAGRFVISEKGGAYQLPGPVFDITDPRFGAKGDATTDDHAAIQAAYSAALAAGGGTVFWPKGKYRITDQVVNGYKFVDENDLDITTSDYTLAASFNSGQFALAQAAPLVHTVFDAGAYLWCDYSASKAGLYNGICATSQVSGDQAVRYENVCIIGQPGMSSGGAFVFPTVTAAPSTNTQGLFAAGAKLFVSNYGAREVARGLVMVSCFWSIVHGQNVYHSGIALCAPGSNAVSIHGLKHSYASTGGLQITGASFSVRNHNTEECAQSLYVPNCDGGSVDGTYYEAVGTGLTDYQVLVGGSAFELAIDNSHLSSLHGKSGHVLSGGNLSLGPGTHWYPSGSNGLLVSGSAAAWLHPSASIGLNSASSNINIDLQPHLRLLPESSPALSSSNTVHLTANDGGTGSGGQLSASTGGGPYVWIPTYEKVYLGDKRFGLKADWNGTTGTADDAAWAAAIAAVTGANRKCELIIPAAIQSRVTSPMAIPQANGFVMRGHGSWSSQIVLDPGSANGNGIVIPFGVAHRYEGFAILGRTANPAGACIYGDSSTGAGGSGHEFNDLRIGSDTGTLTSPEFNLAFYWDDTNGNNSEMTYRRVEMTRFALAAVQIPGDEQYGHVFEECGIYGYWDGVAAGLVGGSYGILAGGGPSGKGGSFTFKNSSVGGVNKACFSVRFFNGQPVVIEEADSENAYSVLDGDASPSGSSGAGRVEIVNGRWAFGTDNFPADGVIKFAGLGSLKVVGNSFFGAGATPSRYPKIAVYPNFAPRDVVVEENLFLSKGSAAVDPIIIGGTAVNYRRCIQDRNNRFVDASGSPATASAYRNEVLNVQQTDADGLLDADSVKPSLCDLLYAIDLTTFNAASSSQTIAIPSVTLPKQLCIHTALVELYEYITMAGAVAVSVKIGTTSGGNELLTTTTIGDSGVGDMGAIYGRSSTTGRGSEMPYFMPTACVTGTGSVYVTLTAASGNLGNGSVSNITRGKLHLNLKVDLAARWIA